MFSETVTIQFAEYPEVEVTLGIRPVSGAAYWAIFETSFEWGRAGFERLAAEMAPFLVSMSPEHELAALDPNLLLAIRNEWCSAVREAPLPLPVGRSAPITAAATPQPSSSEPASPTA